MKLVSEQKKVGGKLIITRNGCFCETAVRMLKAWMGIADHAKKAENSEHLVESYKLKLQSAQKVF